MKETPQEYVQRILGYLDGKDPLGVLMRTAKHLGRLIKGAAPSALRARPAPGKWSVAEILAHLADTEIVLSWRIRAILGAPGTALQPFDQDAWVASGHYDRRPPRRSLELFRVLREMNVALCKALTPEQWRHHGVHGERGIETVEHMIRLYAGHDLNHTQQIERILAAKTRGGRGREGRRGRRR
jgi:DinB superfamily